MIRAHILFAALAWALLLGATEPQAALLLPSTPQQFPPSFHDSPLAFGGALFSLMSSTGVSLLIMLTLGLEAWQRRGRERLDEPVSIVRIGTMLLMAVLFIRSIGDVGVLLLWEASPETMSALTAFDRYADFMSCLPLMGFALLFIRGRAVVTFQLIRQPIPADLMPTMKMLRRPLATLGLILIISIGVTIAK